MKRLNAMILASLVPVLPVAAHTGDAPHIHPEHGAAWLVGLGLIAMAGTAAVVRARSAAGRRT